MPEPTPLSDDRRSDHPPAWLPERDFARFVQRRPPLQLESSVKLTAVATHHRRINAWYADASASTLGAAFECLGALQRDHFPGLALEQLRRQLQTIPLSQADCTVLGTDFRRTPGASRLKLAFSFGRSRDAVRAALALHPPCHWLRAATHDERLHFGFTLCGRGRIYAKLYPGFDLEGDGRAQFDRFAARFLGRRALALARRCRRVHITAGPPGKGLQPILHFEPHRLDDFVERLPTHALPLRAHIERARAAAQHPKVVSVADADLRRDRITACTLYAFAASTAVHA